VALDAERRVVLANPAGQGYLAALGDAGPGEILSRLGSRPLEQLLDSTLAGLPHEVQTDGAKPRVFEIYANPAPVGQGSAGWMLLLRDVTEARLVQARVQQQERLAAVGQLAAGIAHDFNNTMAAIILYSEMLLGKPEIDPLAKDRLTTILRQAERAAALTRQILDFSRRAVMEPQPMEMKPFLKELGKLLVRTLPENIHVTLELCAEDCVVSADPARLQQVFMNLAFNARDAMPAGGDLRFSLSRVPSAGEVTEELPSHVPPGEWVCIGVSDTGVGIAPEIIAHIFEPFFTTKPVGQGTGLGLAQAYGIIKQHNGLIDVKSSAGQGSTFTIYIPAMPLEQGVDVEPSAIHSPRGHGETVLVVEDNPATAQAVGDILESLDYAVITAKNGREALEVYRSARENVSLVFTDLVMPEMGGMQLYRALREINPEVKVVLTTGYPLGTGTKELLGQGNLSWIQKPYNSDALAQCLCKALDS
jgi:signal transduction histidine kinase